HCSSARSLPLSRRHLSCRLSAGSVGGRDGSGILHGKHISVGGRTPAAVPFAFWVWPEPGLRSPSGFEHLRRSEPLVGAELQGFHHPLVPKLHQVPSFAPISAHDPWAGVRRLGMAGTEATLRP